MDVAWEYQHNAVEITVAAEGDNRPQIAQFGLMSSGERRLDDMVRIIEECDFHRVMVFCNMKNTVRRLGIGFTSGDCRWIACMAIFPRSNGTR